MTQVVEAIKQVLVGEMSTKCCHRYSLKFENCSLYGSEFVQLCSVVQVARFVDLLEIDVTSGVPVALECLYTAPYNGVRQGGVLSPV